ERREDRTGENIGGPQDLNAAAVAHGILPIAAQQQPFIPPTTTPKTTTAIHCSRLKRWILGRVMASSTTAARPRRSVVVPQDPSSGNSWTASAAPNWREKQEARMNITGIIGTPGAEVLMGEAVRVVTPPLCRPGIIGRAHVCTTVTFRYRMPSSS